MNKKIDKYMSALDNISTINLTKVLVELGYEKASEISFYGMNDYPDIEMQGDLNTIYDAICMVKKLDKALDKACDELESYDYQANLKPYQYDTDDYKTSKEWKTWCLKDE